ncbi:MAG TPA: hypothetical protein DDW91_11980 [Shewanella frigidimarina]|uniref:CRISPR-associated DxTHG motif protein n=1 Tax=Shewanella livingstonensis TaxID=150120 RepID=A0A3G8LUQ9_9GAMM|nr:CRISPR-associated DxTHG motif protein [Shewanella livingstonensis]HBF47140.1 hypothetical protein [Shewanella frigidimarina]
MDITHGVRFNRFLAKLIRSDSTMRVYYFEI